jgi:hypothetical protein
MIDDGKANSGKMDFVDSVIQELFIQDLLYARYDS